MHLKQDNYLVVANHFELGKILTRGRFSVMYIKTKCVELRFVIVVKLAATWYMSCFLQTCSGINSIKIKTCSNVNSCHLFNEMYQLFTLNFIL